MSTFTSTRQARVSLRHLAAAAVLVAQFFLSVVDAIGESTTFFLFAFFCVVTYVFVWKYVPETKGKSLEEIQERWVLKGDRMLEEEPAA